MRTLSSSLCQLLNKRAVGLIPAWSLAFLQTTGIDVEEIISRGHSISPSTNRQRYMSTESNTSSLEDTERMHKQSNNLSWAEQTDKEVQIRSTIPLAATKVVCLLRCLMMSMQMLLSPLLI